VTIKPARGGVGTGLGAIGSATCAAMVLPQTASDPQSAIPTTNQAVRNSADAFADEFTLLVSR
jgi:hypothetical protein